MSETTEVHNSRRDVPHVVDAIARNPWAISDDGMDLVLSVAMRENELDVEALEKVRAARVQGADGLQRRDGVGIINVRGPIIRYGSFFSQVSGTATYEGLMRDLEASASDATIRAILLNLDTPGGEVNGCAEFAAAVRAAGAMKPLEAYVGGQACSAGYWIASAANFITIESTAVVGSIGVRMGIRDTRAVDAARGVRNIEFISSRAPNKRLDYDSDDGRARIQRMADSFEAVFIGAVASYRGVTEETVATTFGSGGVEVGAEAVDLGMADAIGNFENVLSRLSRGEGRSQPQRAPKMKTYTQAELDAAVAEAAAKTTTTAAAPQVDEAAVAARASADTTARISAILECEEAKGKPKLANRLAFKTTMSADDAKGILADAAAEPVEGAAAAGLPGARAKDAPGGLVTAPGATDSQREQKSEKPVIDQAAIYGRLNGAA